MPGLNRYLARHALHAPLISTTPATNLGLVVVIPCFNEPSLINALEALWACERPPVAVEIIVVINEGEGAHTPVREQNESSYQAAIAWAAEQNSPDFRCFPLYMNQLPPKQAGVGLARKIGMDEAVHRLDRVNNPDGVLACFDADAVCDPDYLTAVHNFFTENPRAQACSIYYEHPLEGSRYAPEVYAGIIRYELYLRYYRQAMAYTGHPHACQTVGSSMAVKSGPYQAQGGMNRRKAGEDFYFLHKFTPLDGLGELLTTRVIPSPRQSDRVPFGTGKAIGQWLEVPDATWPTFDVELFEVLGHFFDRVEELYTLPEVEWDAWLEAFHPAVSHFLRHIQWQPSVLEVRQQCGAASNFSPRFFRWFNALQVLKYAHFARDGFFENRPLVMGANALLKKVGCSTTGNDPRSLLLTYRNLAKEGYRFTRKGRA